MSDRRDQMAEMIQTAKAAAKGGISKVAIIGFVGALIVFTICSAPMMLGLWWWNKAPTTRRAAPLVQPLNAPTALCGANEWLGWYDTAQGRQYFCTPKVK